VALKRSQIGTPRRTRAAWWGLAALLLVAAGAAGSARVKSRHNQWIANARAVAEAGAAETDRIAPALLFAQAHELAAGGQMEQALVRYRLLYGDRQFGTLARYNSGNLLLRQALDLRTSEHPGQALPLLELAKQSYRQVLRADPQHWDARYNFERAQRAQPDPDEMDAPIGEPRNQTERSPTTTRGVGGGMP